MSSNWDDPAETLARAQSARAQGNQELAYQLFSRASELNPQDIQAWQGRAETAASSDEALVSYAYASALAPDNQPLTRTLDAAMEQRLQNASKNDVPLLVALGQEFAEVGLTEQARTLLERASDLDASSTDALVWLAGLAPTEQAQLDYLNRALATNPRDPRARAGLLQVKLPPPAEPTPPPRSERLAAMSDKASAPAFPTSSEEDATMERLRKLRANIPPPEPPGNVTHATVENLRAAAPTSDTRLRNFLILLVVLVVLLVIAGIVLMQLQ